MNEDKIIKNIKERMAISNLEREYSMKKHAKIKILSISMALMLFMMGGFFTVNAATGGQLVENIKSYIQKADGTKTELVPETYKAEDGETYDKWIIDDNAWFLTEPNADVTVVLDEEGNGVVTAIPSE